MRALFGDGGPRGGRRARVDQVQDGRVHARQAQRGVRRPYFGHHRMGHLCRAGGYQDRGHGGAPRHDRRFLSVRRGELLGQGARARAHVHARRRGAHPCRKGRLAAQTARFRSGRLVRLRYEGGDAGRVALGRSPSGE